MVGLNITFFIQLLNFLCAYILLDRFFFRRVITIIDDQNHQDALKRGRNELQEIDRDALIRKQDEQWQSFKNDCAKTIPGDISVFISPLCIKGSEIVDQEQKTCKDRLYKLCVTAFYSACGTVRK